MSNNFLRALPSSDKDELIKLTTVQELPKPRFATKLALTAYPNTRRGRKLSLSHIEVYKMVESVAGKMREAGIRPGTVVAFSSHLTSCESIILFYAIVWIAAIAAPIDPDLPPHDFQQLLRRSGAKLFISPSLDSIDSDDEPANALHAMCHDACSELAILEWHMYRTINEGVKLETHGNFMGSGAAWSGGSADFKIDQDDIAVHLHSTNGFVPLSHLMLCETAKSFVALYNLSLGMSSTMLVPPMHDPHAILILIAAFYSGGHIVLPGHGGFSGTRFWELAAKHSISWLSASPDSVLSLYDELDSGGGKPVKEITQLDFIRSSGGVNISAEVLEKVERQLNAPVFQSYGPAETAGLATSNVPSGLNNPGSVGLPAGAARIAIFDRDTKKMCPPGVVGEIAVAGPHVASGYVHTEEEGEGDTIYITHEQPDKLDLGVHVDEVDDNPDDEEHNQQPSPAPVELKWISTGDRGLLDDEGFLIVKGNSKELRADEIRARELEAVALAKADAERAEVERQDAERRAEEERIAEEKRIEEERQAAEERAKQEERDRELAATAALAAAAKAKQEEEEAQRRAEEEEKERAEQERNAALVRAGVDNPQDIDDETAAAILARLEAIEANHQRLRADVEGKNAAELEEMRRRVSEAEAEAERLKAALAAKGEVVDLRMEELEAAVLAAAASAESSASNTREAVKAAREVADAAYGTNHSQPVEVKASTGDQGALTKTVKVSLDEVEKAMRTHPAVAHARAFGRKDKRFGAEVYCAIEPKRGARVSEPWLKLHAQSVLPAPMVPKKFYYMAKIPDGMSRKQLSESSMLQDLSEFSGYSDIKHVKGPEWKPKHKRRTGM